MFCQRMSLSSVFVNILRFDYILLSKQDEMSKERLNSQLIKAYIFWLRDSVSLNRSLRPFH